MSNPPRISFVIGDVKDAYASLSVPVCGLIYDLPSPAMSLLRFGVSTLLTLEM